MCEELTKYAFVQTYTIITSCIDFLIKVCKRATNGREKLVGPNGKDVGKEAFDESLSWIKKNKQSITQLVS